MSHSTRGREARSQRRVIVDGVCVQLPLRVERGEERGRVLVGVRSGGGKEEGWLRVDTMVFGLVVWEKVCFCARCNG